MMNVSRGEVLLIIFLNFSMVFFPDVKEDKFMKILLVCNAGMSTSMLVSRMQKAAESRGIQSEILAVPILQAENMLEDWDIVMMGPQVRHQLKYLQDKAEGKTPICVIDMRDYGMMNGEKVLDAALKVIG